LLNPGLNIRVRWVAAAAVSVVIGVFFERYYLVIPGAAYPQPYYSPGNIEGVWGSLGSFALTPVEMVLSAGILALVGLLFLLGLKYLELLPLPVKQDKAIQAGGNDPGKEVVAGNT
jgi:Ni/Fe-hydrogenase subunit HybB-like protein